MNIIKRLAIRIPGEIKPLRSIRKNMFRLNRMLHPPHLSNLLDTVEAAEAAGDPIDEEVRARAARHPAWAHYLERCGYLRIKGSSRHPYEWIGNVLTIYHLWNEWIQPQTGAGLSVFADLFTHKGKPVKGRTLSKKSNMAKELDWKTEKGLEHIFFSDDDR